MAKNKDGSGGGGEVTVGRDPVGAAARHPGRPAGQLRQGSERETPEGQGGERERLGRLTHI